MIKLIIFDRSWTLKDNFKEFVELTKLICDELWLKYIPENEIKETFTLPYMKFWNHYFPELKKEEQDKAYLSVVNKTTIVSKPYTWVRDILLEIKNKSYKLMIVSSDGIEKANKELVDFGMVDFFDEIHTWIHEKSIVLKEILNRHSLKWEEVLYIGDTSWDVEAGKSAWMKTVWISRWFQSKTKLKASEPDYLIDDILELKNII